MTTPSSSPGGVSNIIDKKVQEQYKKSQDAIRKNTQKQIADFGKLMRRINRDAIKKAPDRGAMAVSFAVESTKDLLDELSTFYVKKMTKRGQLPTGLSGKARLDAVAKIPGQMKQDARDHASEVHAVITMMKSAFIALSKKGAMKPVQFAIFRSVIEGMVKLYKEKKLDAAGMIVRTEQQNWLDKDLKDICGLIHKYKYVKKVEISKIEANIPGVLIAFMTHTQRYEIVMEMAKRYGADEAYSFAKSIADGGQLYSVQLKSIYEKLYPGKKFSGAQEKQLIANQKENFKKMVVTSRKQRSGMYTNRAEVMISMRGGVSAAMAMFWGLGAIASGAAGLKDANGNISLTGPLSNPWLWINGAGAALAADYHQKIGSPRRDYATGFIDGFIIPPMKEFSPFGDKPLGRKMNFAFKEMASLAGTFSLLDEWLMDKNGSAFQVLHKLYNDEEAHKTKQKVTGKKKKLPSIYDRALTTQEDERKRRGGVRKGKGEKLLEKAKDRYGKDVVERCLRRFVRTAVMIPITKYSDMSKRCPNRKKASYMDYYKMIQGMNYKARARRHSMRRSRP